MSGWSGICEHCKKNVKGTADFLQIFDFWSVNNHRKWLSYHIVCDNCYQERNNWCDNVLPARCQKCGSMIESGEHHLEKEYNRNGEKISLYGLDLDETCNILCDNCYCREK